MGIFRQRILKEPTIPVNPTWALCEELTSTAEPCHSGSSSVKSERKVTWSEYPYRYMLAELVVEEPEKTGLEKGFELSRLSAERADIGGREYDRYMIAPIGVFAVLHSNVSRPVQLIGDELEAYVSSTRFAIDNGLIAPNAEDVLEVEVALQRAQLDGVEPYNH